MHLRVRVPLRRPLRCLPSNTDQMNFMQSIHHSLPPALTANGVSRFIHVLQKAVVHGRRQRLRRLFRALTPSFSDRQHLLLCLQLLSLSLSLSLSLCSLLDSSPDHFLSSPPPLQALAASILHLMSQLSLKPQPQPLRQWSGAERERERALLQNTCLLADEGLLRRRKRGAETKTASETETIAAVAAAAVRPLLGFARNRDRDHAQLALRNLACGRRQTWDRITQCLGEACR